MKKAAANRLDALNAKQVQPRNVKLANLLVFESGVNVLRELVGVSDRRAMHWSASHGAVSLAVGNCAADP